MRVTEYYDVVSDCLHRYHPHFQGRSQTFQQSALINSIKWVTTQIHQHSIRRQLSMENLHKGYFAKLVSHHSHLIFLLLSLSPLGPIGLMLVIDPGIMYTNASAPIILIHRIWFYLVGLVKDLLACIGSNIGIRFHVLLTM